MYLSIHSIHDKYLQQTTKKLQDPPLPTKTLPLGTSGHPWGSSVLRQNGVLSLVALAFPRCEQRISRSWATAAEWDHVSQSSVTWFQNNKGQEEFFFFMKSFFSVLEGVLFFCGWNVFGVFHPEKDQDGKIMLLLLSAGRPGLFCFNGFLCHMMNSQKYWVTG